MIGIYRIRNLINGKCYYGSSKDIESRWKNHKKALYDNSHYNTILQRAWNKYGAENMIFEIVEECEKSVLLEKEQKYLDKNPEYNIGKSSNGGDNLTKNPRKSEIVNIITKRIIDRYSKMTDEEKIEKHSQPLEKNPNWKGGISIAYCKTCGKKISQGCTYCKDHVQYDREKEKNSFYGKKHSDETIKILREKRIGKKPTNMKQVMIDSIIYESLADASRKTGIPSPTILWRINSKNNKFIDYKYV